MLTHYGSDLKHAYLSTVSGGDTVWEDDVGSADLTKSGSTDLTTTAPSAEVAPTFPAGFGDVSGGFTVPGGTKAAQIGFAFYVPANPRTDNTYVPYLYQSTSSAHGSLTLDYNDGVWAINAFGDTVDITTNVGTLTVGWHTCVIDVRGDGSASSNPMNIYIDGALAYQRLSAFSYDPATQWGGDASTIYIGSASVESFQIAGLFFAYKATEFTLTTLALLSHDDLDEWVNGAADPVVGDGDVTLEDDVLDGVELVMAGALTLAADVLDSEGNVSITGYGDVNMTDSLLGGDRIPPTRVRRPDGDFGPVTFTFRRH